VGVALTLQLGGVPLDLLDQPVDLPLKLLWAAFGCVFGDGGHT
jgi:hypothetical protein